LLKQFCQKEKPYRQTDKPIYAIAVINFLWFAIQSNFSFCHSISYSKFSFLCRVGFD